MGVRSGCRARSGLGRGRGSFGGRGCWAAFSSDGEGCPVAFTGEDRRASRKEEGFAAVSFLALDFRAEERESRNERMELCAGEDDVWPAVKRLRNYYRR